MPALLHRALLLPMALGSVPQGSGRPEMLLRVDGGVLRGGMTAAGGRFFLGVPFAKPPTGAHRWMPPVLPMPWPGVRDATTFSPPCAQQHDWSGRIGSSEDCLYLDIYTPPPPTNRTSPAPADGKAVLIFMHGGGFMSGDSEGPSLLGVPGSQLFNGSYVAEAQDVVVISINYRVGVFGFLGSAQLAQRTAAIMGSAQGTGNYGIMDQRMAMQWVQRNAAAIGGDPRRVLIHGCSAGGVSIANHLTQPLSWPLFSSAVMESGNQLAFVDAVSMADAQTSFDGFLASVSCASVDCLLQTRSTGGIEGRRIVEVVSHSQSQAGGDLWLLGAARWMRSPRLQCRRCAIVPSRGG